ncbi:extracellular solute-binding protein [Rubrimonas cliftonensis]|nr:extracellular solute-binding protein [Rubrimonas cliftonensis]
MICAVALNCAAAAADPYAPYRGDVLRVMFPSHPHFDAAASLLTRFTEETGVEVEVETMDYLAMMRRQSELLAASVGRHDLIAYVAFTKADLVSADRIWPLAPFLLNPRLADPDYDAADLVTGYLENVGVVGGAKGYLPGALQGAYGVPFGAETSVLGYRRDVFERHGLAPPETYDELLGAACLIPELEPGMAGLASRSEPGHNLTHAFLLHLAPLGGRVFDDGWNYVANNPQGVAAGEALKRILACSGGADAQLDAGEARDLFLEGGAAMYLDSSVAAGAVGRSPVAGLVGWAAHPVGVRRASQTRGFGLAIPRNAPNPEAAFLLMQWLTSKPVDRLIALGGGNPSRFSTHADRELNARTPHLAVFGEALRHADPDWRPIIPVWGRINAMLGLALARAMTGEMTVQAALDSIAAPVAEIMAEAGYHVWRRR